MIAGYDEKVPKLYYCDNTGKRIEGNRFAMGSGGTFAYGIMDTYYRNDLTLDEAVALGKRAISEATFCDSGSGGYVMIYHIHEKGWTKVLENEDASELVWKHRKGNKAKMLPKLFI